MKVLLDTNVLISYLLTSEKEGTIATIVEAGFRGAYTLLLPPELTAELQTKMATKGYLARKISQGTVEKFITALSSIAEIPFPIVEPIPAVGRDVKDDYLLAYAVVGDADYLVTGDEDLLVVGKIGSVNITSPSAFLELLVKQ
jgi:putative PIN family toxin of toxin-antitoxin system